MKKSLQDHLTAGTLESLPTLSEAKATGYLGLTRTGWPEEAGGKAKPFTINPENFHQAITATISTKAGFQRIPITYKTN